MTWQIRPAVLVPDTALGEAGDCWGTQRHCEQSVLGRENRLVSASVEKPARSPPSQLARPVKGGVAVIASIPRSPVFRWQAAPVSLALALGLLACASGENVPPGDGCVTECDGRECGSDGCDGVCGQCPSGTSCANHTCQSCEPQCLGKQCGSDSCGSECGLCPQGSNCNASGQCTVECAPQCSGRECGPDGCGGTCGQCAAGVVCDSGKCQGACNPNCTGKNCGSDECGGSCGSCAPGMSCDATGQCIVSCKPNCIGKLCGPDGCGGLCGSCAAHESCDASGKCAGDCSLHAFTSCDGTATWLGSAVPIAQAAAFCPSAKTFSKLDATTQKWLVYIPGAPAGVSENYVVFCNDTISIAKQ